MQTYRWARMPLRAKMIVATAGVMVAAIAVCTGLWLVGSRRDESVLADERVPTSDATIRARVTSIGFITGHEMINATLSYEPIATPGCVVSLHVEECIHGQIDCDQLGVLVAHSPSLELGAREVGQLIVLGVSAAKERTMLYAWPNDPLARSLAPDLSGVRYIVNYE